ncbi:MAG: hypothetical protein JWN36_328 [Microbacteriaceae bacterium]|nr:hypothetical protein [Microbacteriaceae bacterium]
MSIFRRSGRPGLLGSVSEADIVSGSDAMCSRVVGRGAAASDPRSDRLATLARLHDDGAIGDEEFERARDRILASPA